MNLADKREILKLKQLELKNLSEKIKSASDQSEDFTKIQSNLEKLEEFVKSLNSEIKSEEKSLANLAQEARAQKEEKMKGGSKLEYLKTKECLTDFAKMLEKTGGREALREAWTSHLKTKGITNSDILLPQAVINSITDAFEKSGTIFATFNYTGLTMLKVAFNTNDDPDTSRAKGHKKGENKSEQIISLKPKEIRAQYIYKYITLDREIIRETQDTGALIRYVLQELPQRIIMEIERAAIIGDGRDAGANDKINSYEAILRDAGDNFVSVQAATGDLLGDLIKMDATITATGRRFLIVNRQTLAQIKLLANPGGLVFPIGSDIASALGYTEIFTPDWMPANAAGAPLAIEYTGESYKIVGDKTMDSFENFILVQNKNEYLMEIYSGGGLDTLKSAAVLINSRIEQ